MREQDDADRLLRWATAAFVIGWAIHGVDHFRRGMSASPPFIMAAGLGQAVLVVIVVVLVLRHHARAPLGAVIVGFASALGFTYAHLLPTIVPGYQDSFVSPPHLNVTWFSWLSALTEIGTAIVFGIVGGWAAARHRRSGPPAFCESLPVDY